LRHISFYVNYKTIFYIKNNIFQVFQKQDKLLIGFFSVSSLSLALGLLDGLRFLLGLVGADVDNLDALLAVVLGATVRECCLRVELVLQEGAAGGLLGVDEWAAVANLLG